jgi:adenosylcobinamide hydrolase
VTDEYAVSELMEFLDLPELVDVGPTNGAPGQCLVWRFAEPMLGISSAMVGGGIGLVSWVINFTVDAQYSRFDAADHLEEIARRLRLVGRGVAMMTAVDVACRCGATCDGATATATVGVRIPVWAASRDRSDEVDATPGTINIVAASPIRLSEAALVNAVATVTEAKVQALFDHQIPGTGTASDAVCILCPRGGEAEAFGGPRSTWGGRLALATYDTVAAGIKRQRA